MNYVSMYEWYSLYVSYIYTLFRSDTRHDTTHTTTRYMRAGLRAGASSLTSLT